MVNMEAISKASGYSMSDSMISWMPLTHDMGLIGFHLNPLFVGMNQYLLPTNVFIRRPSLWLDKATEHKVSILCSPNFGYKYTLKHCITSGKYDWDLSNIRLLYNGAEPISEQLCDEFLASLLQYGLKSCAMCPVYGLAEASLAVSISNMNDEVVSVYLDRNKLNLGDEVVMSDRKENSVPLVNVGKSIENCSIRIADNRDVAVQDRIIGHVQIKGDNVTSGYYNNRKETENAISKDGWLKTGDLGFLKDGALYIVGRVKDIVFINGQNYYPHDIEMVAEEIDGIELNKIAVVGFFNDQNQKDETIGFVLNRENIEDFIPTAISLKEHINFQLGFELDKIIPVKNIPKTTSGKLQRFKLLEKFKKGDFKEIEEKMSQLLKKAKSIAGAVVEPENNIERRLLIIWKKVLNNPEIGVTHNFFELGGNSLKAAEMEMLVLKEFEVELSLEMLFEKQTIKELATEIEILDKQKYKPIPTVQKDNNYALASSQERLYYTWELDKLSLAYNNPIAFRIEGKCNAGRLQDCLKQLIQRHDPLRMSFKLFLGPKFRIHDNVNFNLQVVECNLNEIGKRLKSFVRPFDLTVAPLFRARLLKVKNNDLILFLDFHHIISDGISIHNFVEGLSDLYKGKELEALPIQYKDFVYWEKDVLTSEKIRLQENYWLQHLNGEMPKLEMPLDFPRPLIFGTEGEKIEFDFDKETTGRLKSLARANSCTLNILMFTLYNLLLSKYTGQEKIIIGIPVAGRRHPDLQKLQGMFVNNLAIKSVLSGSESFIQLLERVKDNILHALKNQDYPFERLLQKIGKKRDVGRNPIFDTMFLYQNMRFLKTGADNFSYSRYFFDPGFSKFDISMEVFDYDDSIKYVIEYATKIFKKETILRLAKHFENLVQKVINNPNSKLSDLLVIDHYEYGNYIKNFNGTKSDYPKGKTVYQLFEEQVKRIPNRIAIEFRGKKLTYKQLNNKASQLALLLKEKNVGPNIIVGVLLERSSDLIISILAILKSSGCYLPIDPNLPEGRIRHIIEDSQCNLVITAEGFKFGAKHLQLATTGLELSIINGDKYEPGSKGFIRHPSTNVSSDLAYIIYTSGTTGTPNGVMIQHQSLVNYINWATGKYIKGEKATFPLFTSISFDLTITSIFVPLLSGNKIIVYEEDEKGLSVEKVVIDNKVDVIKLTPSHLKVLIENGLPRSIGKNSIKRIIVGGEELETQLAQDVYDKFGEDVEIYNEYGPTEATVGCMIHKFQPGEKSTTVPIGNPIDNTQVYVLDKFLNPVPIGVKGELYISGDGVALGYLSKERLTREKFISNPFNEGQRMYKTGDIVKRLPNNYIEFIGRTDQQVKINGHRIELLEIQRQLTNHSSVVEAVVTIRGNRKHQKHLCAYCKSKGIIDELVLRNHLSVRLPYYMIPVYFIWLERIPLTPNGKIDYNGLPMPEVNKIIKKDLSPQNPIEKISLKIWEDVLGQNNLSVHHNFFELGGDSIKAIQISSRLLQEGISLNVKDILTYHTIDQISSHAEITHVDSKYEQGVVEGERGLTPIESWFFNQNSANPDYYNQSLLLNLNRKVSAKLLEEVFEKLIMHHDGLRLNYDRKRNKLFYNRRYLERPFVVQVFKAENEGHAMQICEELKRGLHLSEGILIKACVIEQNVHNEQNYKLFITAHHIIIDGISWRILLKDLYNAYTTLEKGNVVKLPRKTASLIDWENQLVSYSQSDEIKLTQGFWQELEMIEFTIPQDFETDDWTIVNLNKISGILNEGKTGFLLKDAHNTYKTNVPILLNVALTLTLKEWTGLDVFVVEQENHGRHLSWVDTSRTIGWFTVMYPVKLELQDDSIGDQIKAIKEQIRQVPNHGIGYGINRYLNGSKKKNGERLTEIRFNYLGQFGTELNNGLFSYTNESSGSDIDPGNLITAKLELNLMVINEELNLEISYNGKAFKESTIEWFKDMYFNHLDNMLEHIKNEDDIHFTPSDFEEVHLDRKELDSLF